VVSHQGWAWFSAGRGSSGLLHQPDYEQQDHCADTGVDEPCHDAGTHGDGYGAKHEGTYGIRGEPDKVRVERGEGGPRDGWAISRRVRLSEVPSDSRRVRLSQVPSEILSCSSLFYGLSWGSKAPGLAAVFAKASPSASPEPFLTQ
jgi:hypothetical protein